MQEIATFAGGCFWCTQKTFDKTQGVLETEVGYTGGFIENPTYTEVCLGNTGHVEAIRIVFDDTHITYEKLLDIFWESIDPKNFQGQFCDIGTQYLPIIFHHNESQKMLAQKSIEKWETKIGAVAVKILPAMKFYQAEDYHQKFYQKDPVRYKSYESARKTN